MFARRWVHAHALPVVLDPTQLKTDLSLSLSQQDVLTCVHVHRPLYSSTFRLGGDSDSQWAFEIDRKLVSSIAIHGFSALLEAEPMSLYSKIGFTQKMKDVKTYEKSTQDLKMFKIVLFFSKTEKKLNEFGSEKVNIRL